MIRDSKVLQSLVLHAQMLLLGHSSQRLGLQLRSPTMQHCEYSETFLLQAALDQFRQETARGTNRTSPQVAEHTREHTS